jgi:hypothetical protein
LRHRPTNRNGPQLKRLLQVCSDRRGPHAAELSISFAGYVRRPVASDLREPRPKADISIVFDLIDVSEPTDIARDKDKMIGHAVWANYLRKTGRKPRTRASRR